MLVNIVTMWLNREMPIESMPAITLNLWNKMCSCLDVSTSIEVQIASLMYQNEAKNWVCSVCFKESTGKTNITRHIEAMHIENHPGYCCDYCNYSTKSRDALRQHINKAHQWPIHNNHLPSSQDVYAWNALLVGYISSNVVVLVVLIVISSNHLIKSFTSPWLQSLSLHSLPLGTYSFRHVGFHDLLCEV